MKDHLIPNSISPAIVLLARDIGGFVILQATFTFIGLTSRSEWGELLAYAQGLDHRPGWKPLNPLVGVPPCHPGIGPIWYWLEPVGRWIERLAQSEDPDHQAPEPLRINNF